MAPFVKGYLEGDKPRLLSLWCTAISKVALLVVPLAVLAILVADQLVVILFTEEYRAAALPFRIYTIILFHRVAEYGLVLRAAGDTRSLWTASFILLIGNVVLSVPLVLLLGMPGPALATLLANIPAWLYVLHQIGRALDVGLSAVFPWGWYGKVIGVAALAAGPVLPLVLWLDWPPAIVLAVATITYLVGYAVLLHLFRLSSVRELIQLARRERKEAATKGTSSPPAAD
jgi:O-antigen/teichoic acid export membrane protein